MPLSYSDRIIITRLNAVNCPNNLTNDNQACDQHSKLLDILYYELICQPTKYDVAGMML